jgi:acyl transferase domain-containing protein/acyl carrier protein
MNIRMVEGDSQSVAVVGMAARFPGAPDVETFWDNLRNGVESIAFFTDDELRASGISSAALEDPNYVKATATIPDIDLFDAEYFNYSPKEAEFIDPQQRVFLECALHALESAGCDPTTYPGSIGVFAGTAINTYQISLMTAYQREVRSSGALRALFIHGNDKDHLTTRTSYKLNLRGPSMAVQTACSTSLVAVHVACQNVLSGECDMALAGGVSVMRTLSKGGYYFVEGGIQSPDGHCRPFDARARGTIFGDGVGVVVLKRLEQALADRDTIHAVIRGSAINNDGSDKVGYTAPSVNGQAAVIAEALAVAGVNPQSVGYIEAHGTGTELGDPIEIAALSEAYRAPEQARASCAIGSVKANIGHLNTAAGIAGFIKAVLTVKHGCLTPALNYKQPNPKIDFRNSPFYVNTDLATWPKSGHPRRAGVSSFGIGGTNAHVVLEEAPPVASSASRRAWHVLLLSGRSVNSLERATTNLGQYLRGDNAGKIADVAYTLSAGRRFHRYARAVLCRSHSDAAGLLETLDPGRVFSKERVTQEMPVVFLFPGQGSQRLNMGRELYEHEPVFRREIDRCCEFLQSNSHLDMRQILFPQVEDEMDAAGRITETEFAQPAIFAVSFALARLWMSWGVVPQSMIGHSIGELVAACLAGVFTLEDALTVVSARGRLMQEMPKGAMLGLGVSIREIEPFLNDDISIAAINGPNSCVVSGPVPAVAEFELIMRNEGIPASRLRTSHAFHSAMMADAVEPFVNVVKGMKLRVPSIPFASNVTGEWITPQQATDPAYWGLQLRQAVRFADAVNLALNDSQSLFLEVGAGRVLTTLVQSFGTTSAKVFAAASLPFSSSVRSEVEAVLTAAAQLWLAGASVDWGKLYQGEKLMKIPLPPYPFDRKRYWIEPREAPAARATTVPEPASIDNAFYARSWRRVPCEPRGWTARDLANSSWLIFAGEDRLSHELVTSLRSRCRNVTVVTAGDAFHDSGDGRFVLSPAEPEQFEALVSGLSRSTGKPDVAVYLWSLLPKRISSAALDGAIDRAFSGPFHLLRALERADFGKPVQFAAIVANTEDVLGGEAVASLATIARGPCQVGNLECRNVSCRYIDISRADCTAAGQPKLVELLINDLAAPASDVVVAYRRNCKWTVARDQVKLEKDMSSAILRPSGVYLVTGGTGSIGLAVAKGLANRIKARLVLVGRTVLPDPDQWERHAANADEADKIGSIIRQIREIEAAGAEVMVAAADVSDLSAMRAVVEQAETRFGAINGVVHAAGVGASGPIGYVKRSDCLRVMKPKIHGTLVLDQIFARRDLDFIVLFSSISALAGYLGHADYSAANAFLDGFAASRSAIRDRRTISINWDLWSETGMATRKKVPDQLRQAHAAELKYGIKTGHGVEAFFRILGSDYSQILVSMRPHSKPGNEFVDSARIESASIAVEPQAQQEIHREAEKAVRLSPPVARRYPRPDLRQPFVAPETELEQIIAEMWAEALSLESIGVDDDFFELGGHSLLALQLLPRLRNRFQIEFSPRDFFLATTVAGVSRVVEEKLIAEIEQMADTEVVGADES